MKIRTVSKLVLLVILGVSLAGGLGAARGVLAQEPPPFEGFGGAFGQPAGDPVLDVSASFIAPDAQRRSQLFITASMKPGYHIYAIKQDPPPVATQIRLETSTKYQLLGDFQASPAPDEKAEPAFDNALVRSHHGRVVWHAPIQLAPGVDAASLEIAGEVYAQACNATSCLPPKTFPFTAVLGPPVDVGGPAAEAVASPDQAELPAQAEAPLAFDPSAVSIAETQSDTSAAMAILMAFLGGVILNLMPCVLPVIGLKLLSFLEQSGQSRGRALMLNVWYSLGMLTVFVLLASLAVFLGFGWGQLFSFKGFNIALAAIVFVMGLSFLGVWEIPIPGFVGGRSANKLAEKEGVAGAFSKGVLTTILATPCSAPFLGTALAWAIRQEPWLTYSVFLSVGLGMASPYLLIGAFPGLIRFLPKPGAWMETFKQVMGFVLMGTVVFLLTFIPFPDVVPTVGLLFGLWFACWWIGRTPYTAGLEVKLRAWGAAAAIGLITWGATFGWLGGIMQSRFESHVVAAQPAADAEELPWQPFVRQDFDRLVGNEQTILVDFTADWCLTCKVLESTYLNTEEVRQAVESNNVVMLKADWTNADPEVTKMLEALGSKQVPVLAVFPAGRPNEPIVMIDGYTKQMVLDALAKAGPSRATQPEVAQASRVVIP